MIAEERRTLTTADGVALEAWVAAPAAARDGLVACHPHPLHGGDMDNPVVIRIVEVGQALGLATVRFNFRGAGGSSGEHGGGQAERADVEAALDQLQSALPPGAPLVVCGYSFGAAVSAHVAAGRPLAGLVLVAPPLGIADYARLPAWPDTLPVLIVAGSRDEYCPRHSLERLEAERPGATVRVIEDATHFFFGRLYPLGEVLDAWLRDLLRSSGPAGHPPA
jgi:uncharacterized protein